MRTMLETMIPLTVAQTPESTAALALVVFTFLFLRSLVKLTAHRQSKNAE